MAQLTPIKGFTNCSVTKSICIITTVIPLVLSILSIKYVVRMSLDPYIYQYHQYWRIITYQLSVVNESDYLLGVLLWFEFKVIERFYGSRRYLSLIVAFAVYNAIACTSVMAIGQLLINYFTFLLKIFFKGVKHDKFNFKPTILNEAVPGPIGLISSFYVTYLQNIPTSYYFKILLRKPKRVSLENEPTNQSESSRGINPDGIKAFTVSNQFVVHILYIILILNNGIKSLIPGLVGLLVGKLYVYDLLPFTNYLIPKTFFQAFINPSKKVFQTINAMIQRVARSGYTPLPTTTNQENLMQEPRLSSEEPEDNDDILDETRRQESQIRAETPVRPLGSQFLDTFRR